MRRVVLLVVSGVLLGAVLTGAAGALPGSQDLDALTWLGTVSTVAALVVAGTRSILGEDDQAVARGDREQL